MAERLRSVASEWRGQRSAARRLHTYAEKAIREAAWRISWHNPNRAFEDDVHGWLDLVLDDAGVSS